MMLRIVGWQAYNIFNDANERAAENQGPVYIYIYMYVYK